MRSQHRLEIHGSNQTQENRSARPALLPHRHRRPAQSAAGRYIEQVGFYDPFPDPPQIDFDEEKTLDWLRKGAQPSEPVERMLKSKGILDKVKANA